MWTEHPTAEWTAQQFRMVMSGDEPRRFLIHDHDSIYRLPAAHLLRCQSDGTLHIERYWSPLEWRSTRIDVAEVVDSELRWWDLLCVSTRERSQFPSVLLHPPPLACELRASDGEMSRRSGFAA